LEIRFVKQSNALHAAIIMDGNGRWAERRGRPRSAGHRAGAATVGRIVEAAPTAGIGTLTLFAFSSDNWQRPMPEVAGLMRLFAASLRRQRRDVEVKGIVLEVIGRRDRISAALAHAIVETERATAGGQGLRLRIALDYSSREEIVRVANGGMEAGRLVDRVEFSRLLGGSTPPLDLIIRTGGEQRLSDFLLWEAAYAELCFSETMWPDFTPAEFHALVAEFRNRERRFGGVGQGPGLCASG